MRLYDFLPSGNGYNHIVDGKLVRHFGDFDSAGLMQQLTG
jgi:hypothetical protein